MLREQRTVREEVCNWFDRNHYESRYEQSRLAAGWLTGPIAHG